jgi:hypothetical protein
MPLTGTLINWTHRNSAANAIMTMSLENELWLGNIVLEAALILLLLYRRIGRTLPVFCIYCAWSLCDDIGMVLIDHFFHRAYLPAYLVSLSADSALEVAVLIELAWSVMRPFRSSLPQGALAWVGLGTLALGAVIWPIAEIHGLASMTPGFRFLVHFSQTASILRVLFFLMLTACSQWLAIGWRDRELQVATGLGFYSLVSLIVELIHSHMKWGNTYSNLNQLVVASYTGSLTYWFLSFSQNEVARQELSPQMKRVLTILSGTARSTLLALDGTGRSSSFEDEKQ